ncbi:MAG TPA: carboxypeptidase-like regulatory domain-containing protein, partial [Fodinibius sp.]|nr:carboxypeptidase-like regulatory domain-containing protein [Fodinibius sp.]
MKTITARIGLLSILLLFASSVALSQTISGTVVDAQSEETLPGVNITVKGTTTGTSSGSQGDFSLTVPSLSDTLVFSFIGYQTQEIPIGGRSELKVVMEPEAIAGEEVVVVGYGTQESGDVTGSVGSVDMADVASQPVTGSDQLMTGQISGVQ